MGFFEGARGRLHYRERPVDGAVAALALLPGSGQHSGHYHEFARRLNIGGIAMWTLDTAGQGLSEGDPERPLDMADLVDDAVRFTEVVRDLVPDLPLALMGHSLGAITALAALGAARPQAPAPGHNAAPKAAEYSADPLLDARELAGLVLCGTPQRAFGGTPAQIARLPRVLAVHGVDDRRAPIEAVRDWARRHDSVQLREYPDAGHDLLHERVRGRVAADIVQWTQEIVAGPERR
ncbi:alpha/beta hydrolase [Nocardia flavorosea]|uniref:Alpha/beta hydrolase n=1 Tax=Nocardia flavorosea TaxID=53429 RepID=A0A846YCE8_9NOCA|nr:alpha/beta fold hydrolase [Nocardia flavorosea]NKY55424.1 alpha/beta hydrolase [Nocardia flavorosea]